MKTALAILLLIAGCALHAAEAHTNLLAIYLLDRPLAQPWPKLDASHLKDLKPVSPPVLTDSDFVAFNVTNHTFVITGPAAKRLALQIYSLAKPDAPGWGSEVPYVHHTGEFELIPVSAPFLIEARGERIYAGAFYTRFSSLVFSGPTMIPEQTFIKTNVSNEARFSFAIDLGYPAALSGTSDFSSLIDRGYHGASSGTADPRDDPRIVSAVQKLLAGKPKHEN